MWAEAIRQWSTVHPEFSYLPRKFKIAVTAAEKDRGATRSYDVGLAPAPHAARAQLIVFGGDGRRRPRAHALPRQDRA